MKNLKFVFIALIFTVLLAACVPSLHPLYTEKDLVFDKELVGTWETEGQIWDFNSVDDKYYKLVYTDNSEKSSDGNNGIGSLFTGSAGTSAKFEARLVKLGENYYLDLYPEDFLKNENTLLMLHIVPCHTFMKVKIENNKFNYQMFNGEWFQELVAKSPEILSHENIDGSVLITASTAELQKFIIDYSENDKLFEDVEILSKK